MNGYKGFEKGMICRGKQYSENTIFEEESAKICEKGMHFCKNALDVLLYYSLVDSHGNLNEFATVESLSECFTDDNRKYCTAKLKIGKKISFNELVQKYISDVGKTDDAQIGSSGDGAQIGSSGDGARIGSSGDDAYADSQGNNSIVCCIGNRAKAKAKKGSWITLAEWTHSETEKCLVPVCVKTEYVDGEHIKENVFYQLENGKFVEVWE